MGTLSHTYLTVLQSYRSKSLFDGSVEVEASPVDEVVESGFAEKELDSTEDRLDWVELRRVANVEYRRYVKLFVPGPARQGLVDCQLVHEQSQGSCSVSPSQRLQIREEVVTVVGTLLDHQVLKSSLCSHTS